METRNKAEENILRLHRSMQGVGDIKIIYHDKGRLRGVNVHRKVNKELIHQDYIPANLMKEKLDPDTLNPGLPSKNIKD